MNTPSKPHPLQLQAEVVMADAMADAPATRDQLMAAAEKATGCSRRTTKLAWQLMTVRGEIVRISPGSSEYPDDGPTSPCGRRLHLYRLARCGERRTPR